VSSRSNRKFPANSLLQSKIVIFGQNFNVLTVADYYSLLFSLLLGFSLEDEYEMRSPYGAASVDFLTPLHVNPYS
jgi:hypothetical protein